jgi:hypothetical protein
VSASQPLEVLRPWTKKELTLALPHLESMNPGSAFFFGAPEVHDGLDGDPLTVVGTNMSGLWFVLADDGSIHLVDDVERELGMKLFPSVEALVETLRPQNAP